jgi:uncharacterized protein YdeI (YjbR/CyaY-like superfamily)
MSDTPSWIHFNNQQDWRNWLLINYDKLKEVWVMYYKKQSAKQTMVYKEALEEALCFGWIDGLTKRLNEESYIQRFTPRRPGGNWSEINIALALKLLSEGRMHESGLKYRDQWIPGTAAIVNSKLSDIGITEFETALKQFPVATANFEKLAPSHRKNYLLWISQAKRQETRIKRITEAIALLEKGEKLGLK